MEKHPDSPGDESVEEALNESTRESMESLGRTGGTAEDEETSPPPSQAEGERQPG